MISLVREGGGQGWREGVWWILRGSCATWWRGSCSLSYEGKSSDGVREGDGLDHCSSETNKD